MRHSIRIRFTLIFMGLTALILIGIWCVNNWMLEGFYIGSRVSTLEQAYEELDAIVVEKAKQGGSISDEFADYSFDSSEQTEAARLLNTLNEQYGVTTLIVDGISDKIIASSSWDADFMLFKARQYILGAGGPESELIRRADNYTIQRTFERRNRGSSLECWGFFSDNRTIFIMSAPLASIRESVDLSNRFLTYVGAAGLICGSLVVYLAARMLTRPILNLAGISERMSRLDFDARYEGKETDEIGVLGNSMNTLSEKLKETIGELQSANSRLQKDIEEKIQIDEMRKEFIANVSHELKTPIALIQGYAEGLTEGMAEEKESRDYYCEVIMDEASKMNKMVRQLLTLTALEFGSDQVTRETFDLAELIRGVLSAAGILIQQKEASVEFAPEHPVYVRADEFKIEEVVTNYISNALNHLDGDRIIRIGIEEQGALVKVTVENTGDPIPEADLPNIWTKFYKVDKARTRAYGGSGIGLSIVKAIMDSHHREYGVENTPDGVRFWFTLDAAKDPQEKETEG